MDPLTIQNTITKRSKSVVTADEWNGIFTLLINQGNALSESLVQVQTTLEKLLKGEIGDITVNVDMTTFGGLLPEAYAKVDLVNGQLNDLEKTLTDLINTKQDPVNLTTGRALVSDVNGRPAASGIKTTELNYLTGLLGNVQNQLDQKIVGGKLFIEPASATPVATSTNDVWLAYDTTANTVKPKVWDGQKWIG